MRAKRLVLWAWNTWARPPFCWRRKGIRQRPQNLVDLDELESMLRDLSQIIWLSPAVVAELLVLARRHREATR